MNELIKIEISENQEPVVSGRMLHEFLEVNTPYHIWFPRMVEYGFAEGEDFCTNLFESTGGRPATDHLIKIDMAKELCMIQRTEKGKQARQYFIQVEKDYNSPEKIMARALHIAQKELSSLRLDNQNKSKQIEEMAPKALFADAVSASEGTILIGELAKILKGNGVDIGQNRLFAWLRENGYLIRRKGTDYNAPTQWAMERGLFKVKETAITHSDGHVTINKTTKVTGVGQQYIINKLMEDKIA